MKIFFVYILQCADGTFYTGLSTKLEKRIQQHEMGFYKTCYTYSRRPLSMVWHEQFPDFEQAMSWEKRIKGWSRRKKLELIEGRLEDLPNLSKNYTDYGNRK